MIDEDDVLQVYMFNGSLRGTSIFHALSVPGACQAKGEDKRAFARAGEPIGFQTFGVQNRNIGEDFEDSGKLMRTINRFNMSDCAIGLKPD